MKTFLMCFVLALGAYASDKVELYKYETKDLESQEIGTLYTSKLYEDNDTVYFNNKKLLILCQYSQEN